MTYNLKFKPNKKRGVKTQNKGNVKNAYIKKINSLLKLSTS